MTDLETSVVRDTPLAEVGTRSSGPAERPTHLDAQTVSLWMAASFGVFLLVAFLLFPGFFPPMSPNTSARGVASFYAHHTSMIRASMIIFNLCSVMLVPLFMVIVHQMKRMSTPTQVLSYCYLSAAASGVTLFAIADLFWLIAAFRPERDPKLIQLLNDVAWITFTAPVGMIVAQNLCLGLAILLDARTEPIFPRWVAYFSFAIAALITPSACSVIFRTGPLAWNGAISFWLRIAAYGVFLIVMFFVLRRAIAKEKGESAGLSPSRLALS